MSLRASDLSRWPLPPITSGREGVRLLAPSPHTWLVMPVHLIWLKECTVRYGFDDLSETLRHLVYLANSEPKKNKRLLFRIRRCLHCHVGARGGQHAKLSLQASLHGFQHDWLRNVTEKCEVSSAEKSLRIILDFYQSRTKQAELVSPEAGREKERDIFSVRRECDPRLEVALLGCKAPQRELRGPEEMVGMDEDDPSSCTLEDTLSAIRRCQVGRGSTSFSTALGETEEETTCRREKELAIENSEEARKARELIRQTLGSIMG